MKVKEKNIVQGFGGVKNAFARVVELPEDAQVPEGAEKVDDETPVSDWALVKEQ